MKPIRLAESTIEDYELDNLASWLQGSPHLTQGPLVKKFEERFADMIGRKHALFVNSGSSANLLAWAAAVELGRKGRAVAPAISWATTVMPALQLGFDVDLLDGDSVSWGLSPDLLLEHCRDGNLPQVVAAVHVLGIPFDDDAILSLKDRFGFLFIEDACAALGSRTRHRQAGAIGDISTFSLYYGHQLSTIEGGMVLTDDDKIAEILRQIRAHGWSVDLEPARAAELHAAAPRIPDFNRRFEFHRPGFNVRGTDLQAFLGDSQLDRAENVFRKRRQVYRYYRDMLERSQTVKMPFGYAWSSPCPIGMGLLAKDPEHRDRIGAALAEKKIETRPIGGGNMALQPFWRRRGAPVENFPVANQLHYCGFQVPCHQAMTVTDVERVVTAIESAA